jgi:hypothetical protein
MVCCRNCPEKAPLRQTAMGSHGDDGPPHLADGQAPQTRVAAARAFYQRAPHQFLDRRGVPDHADVASRTACAD